MGGVLELIDAYSGSALAVSTESRNLQPWALLAGNPLLTLSYDPQSLPGISSRLLPLRFQNLNRYPRPPWGLILLHTPGLVPKETSKDLLVDALHLDDLF